MKRMLVSMMGLLALTSVSALANELDPTPTQAPAGIIVRVDQNGARDVFKADGAQVSTDAAAATAVATYVTSDNQVQNVVPLSELDNTTSTESWWYRYNPYYFGGYGYDCNWYGNNYFYNPYYSWYGYGYSYYYYYRY